MLLDKILNRTFLKVLLAGLLSYYFGLLVIAYDAQVFLLLGVAVFVIVYLIKIEYAFYLILLSRTTLDVFYFAETGGGVRLTHLLGGGLVALFLFYFVIVNRDIIFKLGINKIYGSFLILSIPAVFISDSQMYGIAHWFKLFQGFLFLNTVVLIVTSARTDLYKKKFYLISIIVILAIVYPYILFASNVFQGVTVKGTGKIMRYSNFGSVTNNFAYFLFIIFPFVTYMYSVAIQNSKKIFWFIIMGIMIVTTYFTYVRNIWIALCIFLLTWNIVKKKYLTTFIVIFIIVAIVIFSPIAQERMSDIYVVLTGAGFFELNPKLFAGRIGTWQGNIRYFLDHSTLLEQLFGNGFDTRFKVELPQSDNPMEIHNNYLTLLMNTGVFGLLMYMLYIMRLFQESFRLFRSTKEVYLKNLAAVFIALLFAYCILSIATHILWHIAFQYYFSVFAGFVIAANIIEKRSVKRNDFGEGSLKHQLH
jgi:hypothetical protein